MAFVQQTSLRTWNASSRVFISRSPLSQCIKQQQHLPLKSRILLRSNWKQPARNMATGQPKSNKPERPLSALAHHTEKKQWKDLSTPEKVVTATKTTTNYAVVAAGVVLVGAIGYAIVSELFGSNSDTHVFGDALEKVRNNEKLVEILGTPIKGHGEPSSSSRRRNRRIHSQVVLDTGGKEHLLMRFYVEGPDNEGTAHLEMVKDQRNNWEYKYLFVDIPGGVRAAERVFVEYNKNAGKPAIEDK
ncbi:mitochondrial import inner membrane translocase subunit tim21 [Mortierella sp. AD011]|nr:mitochondrial import inner membrane translocase subunit tim21 [Mortierella sp. AD010]KAF9381055.1 mitochondrial import inner membrane translocase subunit tim21 [Mortierella sp. AD011]